MKKYILIAITAITALACVDNNFETAFREYVGFRLQGVPTSVSENSAGITLPLYYGGTLKNEREITVNYEISGGTYGTDYTVVGGSAATGTITIPAGTPWDDAVNNLVIKGVADFDNEPDVPLTITLTGANDGVQVGYPLTVSYAFKIADDDCLFDFEGDNVGTEANFDGIDLVEDSEVTISLVSGTDYTIEGLGYTMISDFWGETITDSAPTEITIAPGGAITIAPQYVFTTSYNGNPYEYSIRGSGQVNYCQGTITISYEIFYSNEDGGIADFGGSISKWAADAGYTSSDVFEAKLSPVE